MAVFLSVPAPSASLQDSGNYLGEKAMSGDSVNPRKSDSVELNENSHFKCIEINVGSTSN